MRGRVATTLLTKPLRQTREAAPARVSAVPKLPGVQLPTMDTTGPPRTTTAQIAIPGFVPTGQTPNVPCGLAVQPPPTREPTTHGPPIKNTLTIPAGSAKVAPVRAVAGYVAGR